MPPNCSAETPVIMNGMDSIIIIIIINTNNKADTTLPLSQL